MSQRQPKDIAEAARRVRKAMERIDAGIRDLARDSGWLLAMADNRDQVETLASTRGETGYFLVGQISDAYDKLAEFYATAFAGR